MITVRTRRGRSITIISERELDRPARSGDYIRAYCHIHGGDHTRSLSVHPHSGWGFCFNATCPVFSAIFQATVLVAEWNSEAAENLMKMNGAPPDALPVSPIGERTPGGGTGTPVADNQLPQSSPSSDPPSWQQHELQALYRAYDRGLLLDGLRHPRARSYLESRIVPQRVAEVTSMGYLPSWEELLPSARWDGSLRLPEWWCNRVIFPVGVWWPDGSTRLGFCGRSLAGWYPGMSEQEHKEILEQPGMPKRWLKTWPHGWFGYEPEALGAWVLLVEGPFDRCAALAVGFHPGEVVALVGTGARPYWLPSRIRTVVLGLDGDAGGKQATAQLVEHLEQDGRAVLCCYPPADGSGKDWSERYRRIGLRGLVPLLELRTRLRARAS
jgi:Toprim-like